MARDQRLMRVVRKLIEHVRMLQDESEEPSFPLTATYRVEKGEVLVVRVFWEQCPQRHRFERAQQLLAAKGAGRKTRLGCRNSSTPAQRSSPGGVLEIDKKLRAEIRQLQGTRKRLARLAAGEHLALPQSVVDYLDRLRGLGVEERYIELERDAWIMVAAQVPHLDTVIAKKHEDLDDPDTVKLYSLASGALDWATDEIHGWSRSPTS